VKEKDRAGFSEAYRKLKATVGALPGPRLENKIKAEAARAVEVLGVRGDPAGYPVPEEFAVYRDAYLACLWKAAWKRRGAARRPLTSRDVAFLAEQYRKSPVQVRYEILAAAAARSGKGGVEALALCLGVEPAAALAALQSWKKLKAAFRRGEVPWVLRLPPDPAGWSVPVLYLHFSAEDAAEVARQECGPCGAVRYGRRDTHSIKNALEGRARRL
jgi:hypothetical protein